MHAKPQKRMPEPISWERLRAIFGNPRPPHTIWEQQFDYKADLLERIARTAYENFNFDDLKYYYDDLAYSELQPELFDYLFPVCLMNWHDTLMRNQGLLGFSYGVHRGRVFEKMMSTSRRAEVFSFLHDSFLNRLDHERGFPCLGHDAAAHQWIARFNSMGQIMPIQDVWESWWKLDTPGRAVAALEYCSGVMYLKGTNPLFGTWTKTGGGGGPYLFANDSDLFEVCWTNENIEIVSAKLTVEFVNDRVVKAAERLTGEPESELAGKLRNDLFATQDGIPTQEIIESRISELPLLLADPSATEWWSF